MAIYSLHHSSIGKTTQDQPYTAAAHLKYITRDSALSQTLSGRMPATRGAAMLFVKRVEDGGRVNARVMDKVLLALPRELDADQRAQLVRDYAEHLTGGKASWYAAIHDRGKDKANPHCHLAVIDRDPQTGRRVINLSDAGSTQRLRVLWERHANRALAKANRKERIDHRTLAAQGVDRAPTIHVGVRAAELARARRKLASRVRVQVNSCQAKSRSRTVNYPRLDAGKSRLAHNIQIRHLNLRASRAQAREAEFWAAIDADALKRDMNTLRELHGVLKRADDHSLYRSRESSGPTRGRGR